MTRMTKEAERKATEELLEILAQHPEGLPTKDLIGTQRFHGENTLTSQQVIRLLRASGQVEEQTEQYGKYSQIWWTLKKSP